MGKYFCFQEFKSIYSSLFQNINLQVKTTANQLSFALFETPLNNEIENRSVINPWHCE